MNNQTKQYLIIGVAAMLVIAFLGSALNMSVLSVSKITIDPQGYEDPASHEWQGSFWSVLMTTDFDDQITAFMIQNEDGSPDGTFAVTGNTDGVSEKTYATDAEVDGNQLVPLSQVMVHITPGQPYYERPLEIQQGFYTKEAWSRTDNGLFGWSGQVSPKAEAVPFVHYSFGSGSWVLHTPFKVDVYKNGVIVGSQEIDTVGGTGVYRIPASGEEFINILDLGKLGTGYGEPQWDDVLYFSENQIFVRSPTADNLLKNDGGQTPVAIMNNIIGTVNADCFSTYWYGGFRWMSNYTPTVTSLTNLPPGFYREGDTAKPEQPDVFGNIVPYLASKGIQKVSMPTGFSSVEKTDDNNLRVYMSYGAYSSLITIKISTELADTIVWQPQIANFEITSLSDFGEIASTKQGSITVACTAGTGSAQVRFTKTPSDTPVSVVPTLGTPVLSAGESVTLDFELLNLGTSTDREFSITATVYNSLGSATDTETATGTLLMKTGVTTILHVVTEFEGEAVNNLPIIVEHSGTTLSGVTGLDGDGVASFSLGTSSTVSVTVSYVGNVVYKEISKTVTVTGGSEKTVTLSLSKNPIVPPPEPEDWDWEFMLTVFGIGSMGIAAIYLWRRKR